MNRYRLVVLSIFFVCCTVTASPDLVKSVAKIKPAIVGVGIYTPDGRPQNTLHGTGFVIGNGQYIVTNHHVLLSQIELKANQRRVIFTGVGKQGKIRNVKLIAWSKTYDLAVLKQVGPPLPALTLASQSLLPEGSDIAFTGFPMGAVLGLYPVTHQGMIASITPVVIPANNSALLSPAVIKRLKNPYLVYQLDATAYPGNSGSPVYQPGNAEVLAIINKTFVQHTKESALTNPSGISYAIPVVHLYNLLKEHNINIKD